MTASRNVTYANAAEHAARDIQLQMLQEQMQNLMTENMRTKEQLDWECRESRRSAEASMRAQELPQVRENMGKIKIAVQTGKAPVGSAFKPENGCMDPSKVAEALGLPVEIITASKGTGSSGIKDYYDVTLASVSTHEQMVRRRQVFEAIKAKKPELSFVSASTVTTLGQRAFNGVAISVLTVLVTADPSANLQFWQPMGELFVKKGDVLIKYPLADHFVRHPTTGREAANSGHCGITLANVLSKFHPENALHAKELARITPKLRAIATWRAPYPMQAACMHAASSSGGNMDAAELCKAQREREGTPFSAARNTKKGRNSTLGGIDLHNQFEQLGGMEA